MNLRFEWDPKKTRSNLSTHGVSFEEALTVFANPVARIFDDEDHSIEEQREIIIGHSAKERLLVVCFTLQGESVRRLQKNIDKILSVATLQYAGLEKE